MAKINVPVDELVKHGKPRAPKGFYFSHWKGQVLLKKRPHFNPAKFTPLQRAWVEHFKTFACWSKQPDPYAYNAAHDLAAKSGWYYRDVIERAFSGKLIMQEGQIKITVPTARVDRIAAESVTINVGKFLTPDRKVWDTNVFWNSTVNPGRLTFRTPGLYIVGCQLYFNAITGARRDTAIVLNRANWIAEDFKTPASAQALATNIGTIWYFNANDYIEAFTFCSASGVTVRIGALWACAITPEAII